MQVEGGEGNVGLRSVSGGSETVTASLVCRALGISFGRLMECFVRSNHVDAS